MASRVDFYVLEEASVDARLRVACRLAEKAYLAGHTVLVWTADATELGQLDDLLWTFADGSFVPHDALPSPAARIDTRVLLTTGTVPENSIDVVINLGREVPGCVAQANRLADIVDGDDVRRRAARERFRVYREMGLQPQTHKIRANGG